MKRWMALCGLLTASATGAAQEADQAAPLTGGYVFGSVGEAKAKDACAGLTLCDNTADTYGAGLGYEVVNGISLEIGYHGTGASKAFAIINAVPVELESDVSFIALSGVFNMPLGTSGVSVFARLGYSRWDVAINARNAATQSHIVEIQSDGFSPVFGLGLAYQINRMWGIRAEYVHIPDVGEASITGKSDVRTITIGGVFRF